MLAGSNLQQYVFAYLRGILDDPVCPFDTSIDQERRLTLGELALRSLATSVLKQLKYQNPQFAALVSTGAFSLISFAFHL